MEVNKSNKPLTILYGDQLLDFLFPLYDGFTGDFYVRDNKFYYEDAEKIFQLKIETIFFGPLVMEQIGKIESGELYFDKSNSILTFNFHFAKSAGYLWDRDTLISGKLNLYEFEVVEFSLNRRYAKLK